MRRHGRCSVTLSAMNLSSIGLVGFGEVGQIFGTGLRPLPGVNAVSAWDLKFE